MKITFRISIRSFGTENFPDNLSNDDMIEILELYKQIYDENVSSDDWFPQVRDMAETIGYAKAPKV